MKLVETYRITARAIEQMVHSKIGAPIFTMREDYAEIIAAPVDAIERERFYPANSLGISELAFPLFHEMTDGKYRGKSERGLLPGVQYRTHITIPGDYPCQIGGYVEFTSWE